MKRTYRLSASSLSVLLECPRCFWLQVREDLRRPQGPFPSLPSGIDAVLKAAMDGYRERGQLPPELKDVTSGELYPDMAKLTRWRDSLRGDLRHTDTARGIEVVGGIDDLIVEGGKFTPLDFKTRGWAVKEDSHRHYEHQLDLYAWLFERLGHRTSGRGILLFFSPTAYEGSGLVKFRIEPVVLKTDAQRAEGLLERAAKILHDPMPKSHGDCAFCHFVTNRAAQEIGG